MVSSEHGRITIELCSGVVPNATTMAISGMHGDMPDHGKSQDPGNAEMPCAFAGLSAATLGAVDPVQLITLIAFVMAIGLSPAVQPATVRRGHLRPLLRGAAAALLLTDRLLLWGQPRPRAFALSRGPVRLA